MDWTTYCPNTRKKKLTRLARKKTGRVEKVKVKSAKYGFIRYADDFIVTAQTREDIEAIIPVIKEWLKERGLTRSSGKNPHHPCRERLQFPGVPYPSVQREDIHLPSKRKSPSLITRNPGMAQNWSLD